MIVFDLVVIDAAAPAYAYRAHKVLSKEDLIAVFKDLRPAVAEENLKQVDQIWKHQPQFLTCFEFHEQDGKRHYGCAESLDLRKEGRIAEFVQTVMGMA